MALLKLRYENGHFVPLGPVPELEEGDEIEVTLPDDPPTDEAIKAMLDKSRGVWADWDDIEEIIADSRDKWRQAWQDDQLSS